MRRDLEQIAALLEMLKERAQQELCLVQIKVDAAERARRELLSLDHSADPGDIPGKALERWADWKDARSELLGQLHVEALARRSMALDAYGKAAGRFEAATKMVAKSRRQGRGSR